MTSGTATYTYPYPGIAETGTTLKQTVTVSEPGLAFPPVVQRTVRFVYTLTRTPIYE